MKQQKNIKEEKHLKRNKEKSAIKNVLNADMKEFVQKVKEKYDRDKNIKQDK